MRAIMRLLAFAVSAMILGIYSLFFLSAGLYLHLRQGMDAAWPLLAFGAAMHLGAIAMGYATQRAWNGPRKSPTAKWVAGKTRGGL